MTGNAAAIVRSGPIPDGHFALDRQVCEKSSRFKASPCRRTLAFKEAPSDRSLHPKLLRGAWPRAANLVADETIAGRDPKPRLTASWSS